MKPFSKSKLKLTKLLIDSLLQVLGVWSTDYIPRGTRFGPLVGTIYRRDEVPKNANRKYFWRVYADVSGGTPAAGDNQKSGKAATQSQGDKEKNSTAEASIRQNDTSSGPAGESTTCGQQHGSSIIPANEEYIYIDGYDTSKANWMRYVNPAYSTASQNLVACQVREGIYFYTIKPILPHTELLVWYSKEFAQRLNYPLTGELMLQKISKSHDNCSL